MDKLIYEAESLLNSVKMGAKFDKDQHLLDSIARVQQAGTKSYIDITKNVNKSEMSNLKLKENQLRNGLKRVLETVSYSKDKLQIDSYTVSNLVKALSNYKSFKNQYEDAKKNNNELEIVISIFGDFSATKSEIKRNKKVERYKTTEVLLDERNQRLAFLNEAHAAGEMDDDSFMRAVVAVRRVYQRASETAVAQELVGSSRKVSKKEQVSTMLKTKFKKLVTNLSKVFKINLSKVQTDEKKMEDFKKIIIGKNAMSALGAASDIIVSTKDSKKETVQDEVSNIANTAIEIDKGLGERNIIDIKTALKILKVDIMQAKTQEIKDIYIDKALNFGSIMTKRDGRLVPNTNIKYQKNQYIEYMHSHNEISYETTASGVPIEKFKDEKVQREYEETLKQFDKNIIRVEELKKQFEKYDEKLQNKFDGFKYNA